MNVARAGSTTQPPVDLSLKARVNALEQWIGAHVRDEADRAILLEALHELAQGIREHSR